MSKKLYEENSISDIADAIRIKNGTQNRYTVAQMGNAVRAITTQPNLETLNATENGNYLPSANKDGFSEVAVNVPNSYTNSDEGKVVKNGALVAQTARATAITENGTYDTTENDEVTVNVSGGAASIIQPLSVTQNGTYNPPSGVDGFSPVTVNVSGGSSLPTRPSLPSEYQEVEYIYFDGNSHLYVEAHFAVGMIMLDAEAEDTSVYQLICGCRDGSQKSGDWNFGFQDSTPRWYLRAGATYYDKALYFVSPKRLQAKAIIPFILSLDGSSPIMRNMFYIGNYYPSKSSTDLPWTGKLYYLAIIKTVQNEWADYYVPCYRKSDNTVGMYDVINDVFYTNLGSGTLTAGPNVA